MKMRKSAINCLFYRRLRVFRFKFVILREFRCHQMCDNMSHEMNKATVGTAFALLKYLVTF